MDESLHVVLLKWLRYRRVGPHFRWRHSDWRTSNSEPPFDSQIFWGLVLRRRSTGCSLDFPHAFSVKVSWSQAIKVTLPSQRKAGEKRLWDSQEPLPHASQALVLLSLLASGWLGDWAWTGTAGHASERMLPSGWVLAIFLMLGLALTLWKTAVRMPSPTQQSRRISHDSPNLLTRARAHQSRSPGSTDHNPLLVF